MLQAITTKYLGASNTRGVRSDHGDAIEFRPYGCATVLFVTFREA